MTTETTQLQLLQDTPLFKEERERLAALVFHELEQGTIQVLDVHQRFRCMESIMEIVKTSPFYKKLLLEEAEKFGAKEFEYGVAKMQIKEAGVKYSFDACGCSILAGLYEEKQALDKKIKERESFLKAIPPQGIDFVDVESGDVIKLFPPSKSSQTIVVTTLK